MSNIFDDMRAAMRDARTTLAAADSVAEELGRMLVGRLNRCNTWTLRRLKRELRNFNITTGRWN